MILRHRQPSEYSEGVTLPTAKLSKRERSNIFSCVNIVFSAVIQNTSLFTQLALLSRSQNSHCSCVGFNSLKSMKMLMIFVFLEELLSLLFFV